jgi:non-ribosomal peptide synthetase component F
MTEKESQQVLFDWNATQAEFPDICVHQLFEQQVSEQRDAIALIEGEQSLTYGELNVRANYVAHHLLSLGIRARLRKWNFCQ